MASAVNTGARLDRLPISSFHYRIFWLIGAGMFFDGYDLYVGASVLGSAVQTKFAVLAQVPQFISWTFVGMTIGSVVAGFLGDRFGRRFTYQFNLLVFGLASLVYPRLKVVIGSVTTSAALMLGGVALMVLPTLVVGNELLILGGVVLAVGGWFLAHRHGQLRGIIAASGQSSVARDQGPETRDH